MLIIPTTYYQDTDEYKLILRNFGNKNIKLLRVNCARGSISVNIHQLNQLQESYCNLNGCKVSLMLDIPIPKTKPRIFFKEPLIEERVAKSISSYNNYCKVFKHETLLITNDTEIFQSETNICFFLSSPEFLCKLKIGDKISVGENSANFIVDSIHDNHIVVHVISDGIVQYGKYVYSDFLKVIEASDYNDYLQLVQEIKPDYVALSFIESKNDIQNFLNKCNDFSINVKVVSKVETKNAINNLHEIEMNSEYVMIGRGDLFNDCEETEFSYYINKLMEDSQNKDKYIAATGFLDSITENNHVPSRAELIDVYYFKKNQINNFILTFAPSQEVSAFNRCCQIINEIKI